MSYLNKDARDTMLTAMVAATRLTELTATKQVSPEERKLLRQASTSIKKAMDLIVVRVGLAGAQQLLRMVDRNRLIWVEAPMADIALQKTENYSFTSDELDPILDELMEPCTRCTGMSDCAKRVLFDRVQAPEYNADHDVCQYAYQEATK
jgi:hypothetical protein